MSDGLTELYQDLQRRVLRVTFPQATGDCCGGPACGYPDPYEPFFAYQQQRGYVFLGAPSEYRFNELCREIERLQEQVRALESAQRGHLVLEKLDLETADV